MLTRRRPPSFWLAVAAIVIAVVVMAARAWVKHQRRVTGESLQNLEQPHEPALVELRLAVDDGALGVLARSRR